MSLRFVASPKALSLAFKNVLEFTAGNIHSYPNVVIHAERDGRTGTVSATGIGGALCARDWCEVNGTEGTEVAEVTVLGNSTKGPKGTKSTEVIDDLQKLAMAIGRTSTAKSATVFVTVEHGVKISVEYGGQLLGELAHQGNRSPFFDAVENTLDREDWGECAGPTAFLTETLVRAAKVKTLTGSTVVDVAQLPDYREAVAVAIGPTFRGIMATVDRPLFAEGGPWRDGPGDRASLLQGTLL